MEDFLKFVMRAVKVSRIKYLDDATYMGFTSFGSATRLPFIKAAIEKAARLEGYAFTPELTKLVDSEIGGIAYVDGYIHSADDEDDIINYVQYSALANPSAGVCVVTVALS